MNRPTLAPEARSLLSEMRFFQVVRTVWAAPERTRRAAVTLLLASLLLALQPFLPVGFDARKAFAQSSGICGRTDVIREAILNNLPPVDCALVTAEQLASISSLSISDDALEFLQAGDFNGLTNLTALAFRDSIAENFPVGLFDALASLQTLTLDNHVALQTLPAGVFNELTNLETLTLTENAIGDLSGGVFANLANLTSLNLSDNMLGSLPEDVFDGLTNLTTLNLHGNRLTALNAYIFSSLESLLTLDLSDNFVTHINLALPLPNLTSLDLSGSSELKELPDEPFSELANLTFLDLSANPQLATLSEDIFENLVNLTVLDLSDNPQLAPLPNNIFANLANLSELNLTNSPHVSYTFTLEIDKFGSDRFTIKVREGAPFAMTIGLSAQGGTLSANSATIPAGFSESAPIVVTPLDGSDVTVALGTPPAPPATFFGVTVAAGSAVTFTEVEPTETSTEGEETDTSPPREPPQTLPPEELPQTLIGALANSFSEHINSTIGTAYANNRKYLLYFSGTLFKLVGGTIYMDLADYFRITGEGANGWVTVWIDVTASASLGSPVSAGIFELPFHPSAPDPKRQSADFTPGHAALPGLRLETAELSDDDSVLSVQTHVFDLSLGVFGFQKNLFRFELQRSVIDDMVSGALSGCPSVCRAFALAEEIVPQFAGQSGSLVGLPDLPLRYLSSSDNGPGSGLRHDGAIELVALAVGGAAPSPDLVDPGSVIVPASERSEIDLGVLQLDFHRTFVSFRNTGTEEGNFFVTAEILASEGGGAWEICADDHEGQAVCGLNLRDRKFDVAGVLPGLSTLTEWRIGVFETENGQSSMEVSFKLYHDGLGPFANTLLDEVLVEFREGEVLKQDRSTPEEVVEQVGKAVLTEVSREFASSAQSAVTGRIAEAAGGPPDPSLQLAGQSSGSEGLMFLGRELDRISNLNREPDFGRMLGASSFSLALARPEENGSVPADSVAIWGSGDYGELSGRKGPLSWNGSVTALYLGADSRLRPDLLAGVALSMSWGAFDYTYNEARQAFRGSYDVRMTNVFPYAGWSPSPEVSVWGMAGYGLGDVRVEDRTEGPAERADAAMKSFAAGASVLMSSRDDILRGGTTTVRLKSDASLGRLDVEDNGSRIRSVAAETNRLRAGLEGGYERGLSTGGSLRFSLEAGLRRDGGDGQTGAGLELGTGMRFSGAGRLTAALSARRLMTHEAGLDEWGIGGLVRLEPRAAGRGFSFDLSPAFGGTVGGVHRLWRQGTAAAWPGIRDEPNPHLDANLGYGLVAIHPRGLLTPFAGLSLAGTGSRQYRTGVRLGLAPSFTGSFEGTRHESSTGTGAQHGVRLGLGWLQSGAWSSGVALDVKVEGTLRWRAEKELMLRARMQW